VSLKRRLVAGTLVLLVAGIVTTDLVTSSSLRSFLYGRLDEQIDAAQDTAYTYINDTYQRALAADVKVATSNQEAWLAELTGPRPATGSTTPAGLPPTVNTIPTATTQATAGTTTPRSPPAGRVAGVPYRVRLNAEVLAARLSPDVYVEVIDGNGSVVFQRASGSKSHPDPPPILPKALPVQPALPAKQYGSHHGAYVPDRPAFDVGARGRGTTYRVEAVALPGGTLVTAVPLDPTNQTLASLIHVEVIVSIVVVLALLLLALWIVRFGLRPLAEMTETAGAIAAGDLTRRVRNPEESGEVGRLGAALNGMLSQIEAAFAERTASESRLRRFVADASHELRTPLTSIRGYAELLRKGAFDDEESRQRAAERIEHEASRMGLLVDDLLLLARLDQRRPLETFPVDVGALVREALEAARAVDPERDVSLEVDSVVTVSGDAARLRQVLDNLLRNAVVHTPAGTPVHVKVRRVGTLAVITVADEGPGLDPDQAGRLFDRFYRGSEARTGEGTGLGLSIVAALAAAHGGRAFVRSIPGQGTVFTVEVPAIDGPTLDNGARQSAAGADPAALPAATAVATGPETTDQNEIPGLDEADHDQRPVRH
jgi:two-component system, OmpR family, sensor kinase